MCRLFLLDMLLGNPDRMPCEALGWRGNPHNIMYCRGGTHAGRMVAIDSAVQRRPPGEGLQKTCLMSCYWFPLAVPLLPVCAPSHLQEVDWNTGANEVRGPLSSPFPLLYRWEDGL